MLELAQVVDRSQFEWARASGCAETAINAVAIDRSRQALTLAQTLWSSVAQKQVDLASTFQSDVVNLESASEVRRFLEPSPQDSTW